MIYLFNIIFFASKYLLFGSSFLIIYHVCKSLNISHAALITLAPYLTYLFYIQFSVPIFYSIMLAIILTTFIGAAIEKVFYMPLRNKNVSSYIILLSSLGVYVILQNLISIIWGDDTKSFRNQVVDIGYNVFGVHITTIQVIIIFTAVVVVALILFFYNFTKIGIQMRAIMSNPNLATIFGISFENRVLIASIMGSCLASISGILISFDTDMTPTMGFKLFLYGIVAMIIGGVGSVRGIIIGALLLSFAQQLSAYYIDSKWIDAITFGILIIFLIWKPLGISGQRLKKIEI